MTPFGVHVGFWEWNLVSLLSMCWHFSAEQAMADILYNTDTLHRLTVKCLTPPALSDHLRISALTENSTVIYVIMASYIFLWPPLHLLNIFCYAVLKNNPVNVGHNYIQHFSSQTTLVKWKMTMVITLESTMVMVIRVHHGHHETKYSVAHQRQPRSFH